MSTAMHASDILGVVRSAARRPHPRLFVSADDRPVILDRCRSGDCRAMAERLRMKCEAYLDPRHEQHVDLARYDSTALLARPGQYVLSRVMEEAAFGGWLFDEPRYTALARSIVLRRAREAFLTPKGGRPSDSHCRSPLSMGITGVPLAFTADLLRPALTPAEWADVVRHVKEYYIDYARLPSFERDRLHMTGFNKTIAGMCATGLVALLAAEDLPDEDLGWALGQAVRSAHGYAREGMDDDGGTYEGPGYGAHCINRILLLAEALRRHGWAALSDYEPLHRHGRWMASLIVAGGGTAALGDSFGPDNIAPEILLPARWRDDAALRWAYRRGLGRPDHRKGPYGDTFELWSSVLPYELAWHDPAARAVSPAELGQSAAVGARGFAAMALRSGWDDESVVAVLTGCGRRATAPAHTGAEAGALSLWALGRELLYDPGYGFARTDCHSAVQVAGRDPALLGGNATFGGRCTRFASGSFAALGGVDVAQLLDCRWAFRDVVLVRGARPYLLVADDLNYRSDWAEFDWFWQGSPEAVLAVPGPDGRAAIRSGDAVLDIRSVTPPPDTYPKPYEARWVAERYVPDGWHTADRKGPELQRLRMRLAGYNGLLLTVLSPRRADQAPLAVEPLACPHPGIAVSVQGDGFRDTIAFAPYNRFLQAGELAGNGRLAVVREAEGRPAGHVLVEGYDLAWRGGVLVPPRAAAGDVIAG